MTRRSRTALTIVAVVMGIGQLGARGGGCAPEVKLLGQAGTFGGLTNASDTPSGDTLSISAINYGFSPGQAGWFPAVTSDGTVFVAGLTQSGNQILETGCTMEIACYNGGAKLCRDPATGAAANFALLKVQAGLGGFSYPDAACQTSSNGADVSDLTVLGSGSSERVFFISVIGSAASPPDWPMSGSVRKINGLWQIDTGSLRSALDYYDSNATVSHQACTLQRKGCFFNSDCAGGTCAAGQCDHSCSSNAQCSGLGPSFVCRSNKCVAADCGGTGEIDRLPISGRVVATQYFTSSIAVLDGDQQVLAYYKAPAVANPCVPGQNLTIAPRQVEVDPTSTAGDERFAIAYEHFTDPRGQAVQIFRYNDATHTIQPLTAPFFGTIAWGPQPTCAGPPIGSGIIYDDAGNLLVKRSAPFPTHTLVYLKKPGSSGNSAEQRCATGAWGTLCPADFALGYWDGDSATPGFSYPWSQGDAFDPGQATMFVPTVNGLVLPLPRIESGGKTYFAILPPIDLGADQLPNSGPNVSGNSVTKVALDATRGNIWLPVRTPQHCNPFATPSVPCVPGLALNDWMYRLGIDSALGARPKIVDVSSTRTSISGGVRLTVSIATTAKQTIISSAPNQLYVYRDTSNTPARVDMSCTTNATGHVFTASIDLPGWQSAARIHWYALLKDVVKGTDPSNPAVVAGVETP